MFVAFRYQPGFGPLAVAYAVANIASAIPITPGGLGVIEVTLVAITTGFGAPRATAVLALLSYRLVNYWLPTRGHHRLPSHQSGPDGQPRTWQPPTSSWMNVHAPVPRQRSRSASLF